MRGFRCIDCKCDTTTEYYMVTAVVWAAAGMEPHGGKLCVACLEDRIGRELTRSDFLNVPVNKRRDDRSPLAAETAEGPRETSSPVAQPAAASTT